MCKVIDINTTEIDQNTIIEIKLLEQEIAKLMLRIKTEAEEIEEIYKVNKYAMWQYLEHVEKEINCSFRLKNEVVIASNDNDPFDLNDDIHYFIIDIDDLYRKIMKMINKIDQDTVNLTLINIINYAYKNHDSYILLRFEGLLLDIESGFFDNYEYLMYLSDIFDYYSDILEGIEDYKLTVNRHSIIY